MFIRSERLFLRPGWAEDWDDIFARIADEGVVRNLARAPWPYSEDDARAFATKPQTRCHPHFLVTLPGEEGAQVIGAAGLGPVDDGVSGGAVELGYWLGREHWGRGYATEAARGVLSVARMLGHRRVIGRHFVDNPASGSVLRKLGFRPTGPIATIASKGRAAPAPSRSYELLLGEPEGDAPLDMAA
jgi:RimJ/RimL family protein N-acetyltransferase